MAGTLKSFASALIALVSFVVTAPLRIFLAVFQLLFVAPLELWEQFHGPSEASTAAAAAATAASPPGVGSPPRSPHAGGPHNGSGPILSFGGCGFMYPWQLGVAQFVADTFDCADVRCAGHSAGFAACLTVACGVPVEAHWHALQVAEMHWRSRILGPFLDSTQSWMGPYIAELQPHAARILGAAASGRLCIGYTRIRLRFWRLPWIVAGHAIKADFASIREFVYTVTVSQRIVPFYRRPGHLHGAWGLDGAFSGNFTLPPGTHRRHAVCVSPVNPFADVRPREQPPFAALVAFPTRERWDRLFGEGYRDARRMVAVFLNKGFRLRGGAVSAPAALRLQHSAALAAVGAGAAGGRSRTRGAHLRAVAAAAAVIAAPADAPGPAGAEPVVRAPEVGRRGSARSSSPPRFRRQRGVALLAVASSQEEIEAATDGHRLAVELANVAGSDDDDDDDETGSGEGWWRTASRVAVWPIKRAAFELSEAAAALATAGGIAATQLSAHLGSARARLLPAAEEETDTPATSRHRRSSGAARAVSGVVPRSRPGRRSPSPQQPRQQAPRQRSPSPPPRGGHKQVQPRR